MDVASAREGQGLARHEAREGRVLANRALVLAAVLLAMATGLPALAAELTVRVDDGQSVLADAVVSLHAVASADTDARAIMDQRNTAFVPGVLPVQVGTLVSFPNSDKVQHQVYSFSKPNPFELPLYAGTPLAPVRFDSPGIVVVGCNIHDWMIGYIVVLDTSHFAKTDEQGQVRLELPAGDYRLRVWHSRLPGEPEERPFSVPGSGATTRVSLTLAPPPPERRGNDRLRALQQRVRSLKQDP